MCLKFFPKKSKKSISIDFGSSSVKIVEGKVSNKDIEVTNAIDIKLPQGLYSNGQINNIDELAKIIKAGMEKEKVEFGSAYGVINNSSIITREVTLPKVKVEEIDSILQYQLSEYFPVDPENYIVQYIIQDSITEDEVDKMSILLIGVPKSMVVSHFDLLTKVGFEPEALDYQGNVMMKLLNHSPTINNSINTKGNTIATVDIGMYSSKVFIIKDNIIELTRILDIGANNLLEHLSSMFSYSRGRLEKYIEEIVDINETIDIDTNTDEDNDYYKILSKTRNTLVEITEACNMTFRYYKSRDKDNTIDYVLLHGGLQNIKGTEEMFSDYLNIPCQRFNELEKIKSDFYYSTYINAIGGLIRLDEV